MFKISLKSIIAEISILSSQSEIYFTTESKTIPLDNPFSIVILIKVTEEDRTLYYSPVTNIQLKGVTIPRDKILPITDLNISSIKWYKVEEATGGYYSNTDPEWHWDDIKYKETEVREWRNLSYVIPNVGPSVIEPVYCDGNTVGTMRFKVEVTIGEETYSNPGKDSKYRGSISQDVHRISIKGNTDNEVINFAYALCNLPYIWGSESFTGSKWDNHQAELFIGADCADFCVAAHQLAGNQLPYDSIKDLSHTKIIAKENSSNNGIYLNDSGDPIKVGIDGVQVGDFVYWDKVHVGLFLQDKSDPSGEYKGNADGIFNRWDLVIHTLFKEPRVEPVGEAYYGKLTVYRVKGD